MLTKNPGRRKLDAWNIIEKDFSAARNPIEKLRFLSRYAILAPSSHNTQPWLFRFRDDAVELLADRSRGLPMVDPDDRELILSCGAALCNLRVAIRYFGFEDVVERTPDPKQPDLVARVRMGASKMLNVEDRKLFRAISRRRSNRMPFRPRHLPEPLLDDLKAGAAREGADLFVVREEAIRNKLAALIAEGDTVQMSNRHFRRELAAWVRSNIDRARDGIPGYGFGYSDVLSLAGPFMMRTFDMGKKQASHDRRLAAGSPVLIVVCSKNDDAAAWLRAGEALEWVLLRACAEGVMASFLNQPVEVPALRTRLRALTGNQGWPQVVLRMGYGSMVDATPRRLLDEVSVA